MAYNCGSSADQAGHTSARRYSLRTQMTDVILFILLGMHVVISGLLNAVTTRERERERERGWGREKEMSEYILNSKVQDVYFIEQRTSRHDFYI